MVFVIIGILASIALDVFLEQRRKGWDVAVLSDCQECSDSPRDVLAGSPTRTVRATDMAELVTAGFRPSAETNYFGKTFAMTIEANGGQSYCLTARSESGRYFGFSSDLRSRSQPGPLNTTTCS